MALSENWSQWVYMSLSNFNQNRINETYGFRAVDNGRNIFLVLVIFAFFLADERPQFIQINRWAPELVAVQVEIPHTNFTEVTRMAETQNIMFSKGAFVEHQAPDFKK